MIHEDKDCICNNKRLRSNQVHNIQLMSKNACSSIQ